MQLTVTKDLAPIRAEAQRRVDAEAEGCRQLWLTPGAGMAMVYQAKAAEAEGLLGGGNGPFPMLQAEVDAGLSPDLASAAATIKAKADAWLAAGAAIEVVRRSAGAAIIAATNPAEIEAASTVTWPTPS